MITESALIKTKIQLFALLLFLLILTSCNRQPERPPEEIRAIAVTGAAVSKGLLTEEFRASGIAKGIREAWVVSEAEGLITNVSFSLGERVDEGQILVRLDNDLAALNRDLAVQQYQTALLEYQAAGRSLENESISRLRFSQTEDRLLAAQAAMEQARERFDNSFMTAPFAGVIAFRDAAAGNYMSRGLRVARVIDDSRFRTEISFGEGEILQIKTGMPAKITGRDGIIRSGRITEVSAGSDESTGSFTVAAEWIPQPGDQLKSGMSVGVSVRADRSEEQIIIPASAVRIRNNKSYVFTENEGLADIREIETGARLGNRVEVSGGLEDGQIIITSGISSLSAGVPVNVTVR